MAFLPTQAALDTHPAFQRYLQGNSLPTPTIYLGPRKSSPFSPTAVVAALKLMGAQASGAAAAEKVDADGAGAHAAMTISHSYSPSSTAHPSLNNLFLAVWALVGGIDAWTVQAFSPEDVLPLLQHTYSVSSTATLSGKYTLGACRDGYVTRNTIRSKAAAAGPNATTTTAATDAVVYCLVLPNPALLKHYTAVGSAVGSGSGRRSVLAVLPPTLTQDHEGDPGAQWGAVGGSPAAPSAQGRDGGPRGPWPAPR